MRKFIWLFIVIVTMGVTLNATTPTYENVTKLYVATFDRTPDVVGLKYWVNNSGLDLEGIARSFFDQPETKTKYYPNNTIEVPDFIDEVYINLFDHLPDSSGKEYWTNDIMKFGFDYVSVFILAVINGAQGNDAVILADKTKYAMDSIRDQLPDEPSGATECHSQGIGKFWLGDKELGNYCEYYDNGQLARETPYVHGVRHGTYRSYYSSGNRKVEWDYFNGQINGKEVWWREAGEMYVCAIWEDGKYIKSCMPKK